jgi:predicted ribosomally synthesized peptide with SipW-like signal peptide
MNKKKLLLGITAGVCVVTVGIGGTLMLFTDVTNVGTNVVTFANKPLTIVLQETGWADRDLFGTYGYGNADYKDYDDNDIDDDNYWEFTIPGPGEGEGPDSSTNPDNLNGQYGELGYHDINTSNIAMPNLHKATESSTNSTIPPFYGIEYPDNLVPNEIVNKAPRVVHISGVDSFLRVLAKLNIYEWNGTAWGSAPLTEASVKNFSNMYFAFDPADGKAYLQYLSSADIETRYYRINEYITALNTTDANTPASDLYAQMNDYEKTLLKYYKYRDFDGNTKIWKTFADFLQAFLSDGLTASDNNDNLGGIDYNDFNWKYVVSKTNPATESYYYYINNGSNKEIINQTNNLRNLSLTTYLDYSNGETIVDQTSETVSTQYPVSLAVFGKDEFPTAPLFTHVQVPNITSAMQTILRNYKFTLQFEAQAVQIEGNHNPNGKDPWHLYFSEVESQISEASKVGAPTPTVYNAAETELHDQFKDTPGQNYPYPTITPEN